MIHRACEQAGIAARIACFLALIVGVPACDLQRGAVGSAIPASRAAARAREAFTSERLWGAPGETRWEPVVAADPHAPWVYQMSTGQRPDYLLFRASSDGGRTWGPQRHLCHRGVRVPFQYDPQIAVTGGGTIDVVCLDGFAPGPVFARSRDHGASWSKAIPLDGKLKYGDKPTLAISPDGRDVYVAYNSYYRLFVSVSHDYGVTWAAPVRATGHRRWYYSLSGAVGRDGAVWFAVDGETGRDETGNGHVSLVRSADGGLTWTEIPFVVSHEGAKCNRRNCYPDFYTAQDAVAADGRGNLVFVFAKNDRPQGPNALYVSRSNDDGARWSDASLISNAGNAMSPAIAAAPNGSFRLVWQDDRNGDSSWNTWYSHSDDAGRTWSKAVRLSDRESGAGYKHVGGYNFPFGDYLGLAVDGDGVNHVVWGEGSAIYVPGGTWWARGQ
ncbi:MAG TPA: sialidase family protein [Candidatus Cybelea sp.]